MKLSDTNSGRDHIYTFARPLRVAFHLRRKYNFNCSIVVRKYISHQQVIWLYKSFLSGDRKIISLCPKPKVEISNWFVQHWRITIRRHFWKTRRPFFHSSGYFYPWQEYFSKTLKRMSRSVFVKFMWLALGQSRGRGNAWNKIKAR